MGVAVASGTAAEEAVESGAVVGMGSIGASEGIIAGVFWAVPVISVLVSGRAVPLSLQEHEINRTKTNKSTNPRLKNVIEIPSILSWSRFASAPDQSSTTIFA
jgi:hypothetical protein